MDRKTFIFRKEWQEIIRDLSDDLSIEARMELYEAIVDYECTGEYSISDIGAKVAFKTIKKAIDKDLENYNSVCERNKKNGSKGGRPKKELSQESEKTETVNEKPNKTEESQNNRLGSLGYEENPKNLEYDNDNDLKEIISNEMKKKVEITFEGTRLKPLTYTLSFNPDNKSDVEAYERFDEFRAVVIEWLAYKKHRGDTYKTDESVKKMYKSLLNKCEWNVDYARKIIDDAQASNYSGFFAIKENQKKSIEPEKLSDDGINWENVVNGFNRLGVCRIESLDENRKQKFLRIVKEFGKDKLILAYKNIKDSLFLKGDTKERFVADFDFVFDRDKFIHILEKKYR